MDVFEPCHDAMLPGDEVVLLQPADWSDRAPQGRVTRRWRSSPDRLVVEWDAAPASLHEVVVPRRELRHQGRCPEGIRAGDRVRIEVAGAELPRGTTGRVVAINVEGWIAVAPDYTLDTIAHVQRADLGHI